MLDTKTPVEDDEDFDRIPFDHDAECVLALHDREVEYGIVATATVCFAISAEVTVDLIHRLMSTGLAAQEVLGVLIACLSPGS